MSLQQLSLSDFRILINVKLDLNPSCNILTGQNGAGKTNLLEAIHILGHGKSFRTHQLNQSIQKGKDGFLLVGRYSDHITGIERRAGKTQIKLDGQSINRVSKLAEKSPITLINERCFELVCGEPERRRAFIDWCVFHVEHQYRNIWNNYNRALQQKNQLLRTRQNSKQLDLWNERLSQLGSQIQGLRLEYLDRIKLKIEQIKQDFIDDTMLELEFVPGCSLDNPLQDLDKHKKQELKLGYSLVGAHRDRVNYKSGNQPVCSKLSRGQIKRVAILSLIASLSLVQERGRETSIILVDDLESELDHNALQSVLQVLAKQPAQIFLTNIRRQGYLPDFFDEFQMFHVEHGMIQPETSC